jgi:hypothetical protein
MQHLSAQYCSDWLLFLQKYTDDPWAIEPIYFAATFDNALKYLPLCEGFQDAFSRDEAGRLFKTQPLYYTVDNDGEIYYSRCVFIYFYIDCLQCI